MEDLGEERNSPLMSDSLSVNNGSAVYTDKNINNPTETFGLVILVCFVVFILTVLLFSWLRAKLKRIYSPRLLLMQDEQLPHGKLPSSWFAWISPSLMARDDDIFNHLGLDALVYIRFLKLLIKASIFTLPYGMFILVPLNVHGGMSLKEGLDKVSMSNVALDSRKLWAHLIALWVYSLTFIYIVHEEWKVFALYKQIYLTKGYRKQHVLLVQDIPKENQDTKKFEEYVNLMFPDQVHSVHVVQDLTNWMSLIEKHNKLVRKRERIKAKQNENPDSSTMLLQPSSSMLNTIERRMEILHEALQEEQGAHHNNFPAAFVFFKSAASQASALQVLWDFQAGKYQLSSAPDAHEVIWKNLDLSIWNRCLRQAVSYLFIACLIILWTVPITFIASLTNLQTLSKKLKFLDKFANDLSTITQALIQGFLPVALIAIFNLILPYILTAIGKFSGIVSKSGTILFVFSSLTLFQICNTFFFFILAGSFFSKIQMILDSPHTITEQLAISLPRQANFYLCYVSFLAFIGNGFELTRISSLFYTTFYSKCWAKTRRERLEGWYPGDPPYAILLANDVLVFLIGITYSVISPVIIPAILIHFGFRYIVWVYKLYYVYVQKIDLCGRLWPRLSSSLSAGVVIFQLLMIGVFTLKEAYWVVVFSSPLPFITAALWSYIHKRYRAVGMYLSKKESLTMRNSNPQYLKTLADSYVRNHACPGLFELKEEPDLRDSEANEEIAFCAEGQNGL